MREVDVLVPSCGRPAGLAVVLTSLLGQTFQDFNVVISDQTEQGPIPTETLEVEMLVRALRWHGHEVTLHRHLPRRGIAEQRQFLLSQSQARYVHFLDDDVLLDPPVLERMLRVLQDEQCGFVGCAAAGLQYTDDVRPHAQQYFEPWDGPVRPEPIDQETFAAIFSRSQVNSAANALHLEAQYCPNGETMRYKVAWVGGANVLFDREKLLSVGGFSWWRRLPPEHAGEEVLAQLLLLRKYGGCGVLPCGTYHLCLPTTIANRRYNAVALFGEIIAEYNVQPVGETEPLPLERAVGAPD